MNYLLCHKDIEVLNFEIQNDEIYGINEIYNEEHVPLFLKSKNIPNKVMALKEWWKGRCIPASRQNLDRLLMVLEGNNLNSLIIKSLGLSLSDQYWIKPENSSLKWKDVNFYENDFSLDVGNLFFGLKVKEDIDFISPDNTSDGWLIKKWVINNDERFLIKGGSAPYEQEPFNEVLASKICECLNIPHADYDLIKIDGRFYCRCRNITTADTEIISAWNILNTQKKEKKLSEFDNFLKCCKELKIGLEDKIKNDIGKMIVLDFIIANTDRHYNNFSFLRNSNTLEWMGLSPLFDSGTSMFNKISTEDLKHSHFTDSKNIEAKPFYTKQQKQLEKFATIIALQNINFDSLEQIPAFFSALLSKNTKISEERKNILTAQLEMRIHSAKYIVYRKNEITEDFLKAIYDNKSSCIFLDKIASAFLKISSQNPDYKPVLENYLRILKPKDENEMERLIFRDMNASLGKNRNNECSLEV